MMRATNKLRVAGVFGGAMLLVLVAIAMPLTAAYPAFWNEEVKKLDHDVPVLDTATIAESDLTVKYVYEDEDGEVYTEIIPDGLVTIDADPNGLRRVSVDLFTTDVGNEITLEAEPHYKQSAPYDHYLLVEFPEKAGFLFDETVAHYCTGLEVTSGSQYDVAHEDYDEEDIQSSYRVEVGAGKAVLHSFAIGVETDDTDADYDIADTTEKGECLDRKDATDAEIEFGNDLAVTDVMGFLNGARDGDSFKQLSVKVFGPRMEQADPDGAGALETNETGHSVDFVLQYFTYDEDKRTDYSDMGGIQIAIGGGGFGTALLMTAAFNVPEGDLKPHIRRIRKPAARRGVN